MAHPMDLTVVELAAAVRSGRLTPTQTVEAALERIEQRNGALNAFVVVCSDRARREAAEQTRRLAAGEDVGPLAGVPFGVKDLEDAEGLPTSFGSVLFKTVNLAAKDSVQVARLRAAGAIVVGKTNVPPFGSTAFCKNRAHGTTCNPWDTSKTPGGSSGGSAAAVAARIVPFATAADGGGSIRIPATFCGAFGLKPSFGRVPMTELLQFGVQRWVPCVHFGTITRTVRDTALLLDLTSGYHPDDPQSLPPPKCSYLERVQRPLAGRKLRVVFSADLGYVTGIDETALRAARRAAFVFRELGHHVHEDSGGKLKVELPDVGREWSLMMAAQEYSVLGAAVKGREQELERSIALGWKAAKGAFSLDAVSRAFRQLATLHRALAAVFGEFDLLLTPAMAIAAFAAAGPPPTKSAEGKRYRSPMHPYGFCYPFNWSGHPAAVVRAPEPGPRTAEYSYGLQIVGRPHADEDVLEAAQAYSEKTGAFDTWPQQPARL